MSLKQIANQVGYMFCISDCRQRINSSVSLRLCERLFLVSGRQSTRFTIPLPSSQ